MNQETSAKHRIRRHLNLNLPASRTMRKKFLCSVLQQPERAQTLVCHRNTHTHHKPTGTRSPLHFPRPECKEKLSEHLCTVCPPNRQVPERTELQGSSSAHTAWRPLGFGE